MKSLSTIGCYPVTIHRLESTAQALAAQNRADDPDSEYRVIPQPPDPITGESRGWLVQVIDPEDGPDAPLNFL